MKIYKLTDQPLINADECVATVGFFDGVHLGHRYLINELKEIAAREKRKSVVFTFSVHPRQVLQADFRPALLNTLEEKLKLLDETGIDACVVLDFSIEMSELTAYEFLQQLLFEKFHVKTLLVGHDHRFGHNRTEGFDDYVKYGKQMGMKVLQASRYSTPEFAHISSSEIRKALSVGDIEKTNALLTYPYALKGNVVGGFRVGRKIGFPTANLQPENVEKLIPALGVYAVEVLFSGQLYHGMMNIGLRPTLNNGKNVSLEVNIFDFEQEIYDEELEVKFIARIRDEQKFDGIEALVDQLKKDKLHVLELFAKMK